MIKFRILLTAFLVCFFTVSAFGQSGGRVSDVEVWLKAGGKVDLTDKWEIAFEEQIRFDDDVNALKNFHTEIQLTFKPIEALSLHAVSRYITRNDNSGSIQGFEDLFRYQFGASYKHDLGQLRMKYRALYQHRNEVGISEAQGDIPEKFLRLRTSAEYKIKDWKYDPQVRVEYFNALNDEVGTNNQIRFGFGTERDYKKFGELGFFYLFESSLGLNIKQLTHILSFKYTYTF
ncbi:hypothetical protein BFP97_16055 [Roseivirga sp. 4D4]|uniref:DUF2490 domain-containing protein n=1 Tax=Roseivirga sp. 4D4 TaxID=1889784 RepID=UPI0008534F15|nr:DUF2490 domain-containing protein [Roseivirga sp. 4D4]OEK02944.1 hypothetical protein BFP97_16055 [Roseivirga sp. 4D4]